MIQGNFQKAWIRLRHYIVVAELMGLPKAFQTVQLNPGIGAGENETLHKAQLWGVVCAADRLFGMILNLPPGTRRYQQTEAQPLLAYGVVQTRVYLTRLTDIAAKIQHLDDMYAHGSTEFYATALELARELRSLASQTPRLWWIGEADHLKPDHVVQFLHYCILMRAHLPFVMRQNSSEEYFYSRLACMDACEAVAQRYQFLRRMLPPGFFLGQIMDLQAFTATTVLLLTSHRSLPMDRVNVNINKARIDGVIAEVIKLMGDKSNSVTGSDFARNGLATIRALNRLLQQDDNEAHVQEMTLKVPLLGKVHIRRNARKSGPFSEAINPPLPSELGIWKPNEQMVHQQYGPPPLAVLPPNTYPPAALPAQDLHWDPFSWSIEDNHENLFQDTFMTENFDQFPTWQNKDNNVLFGN